ncbi:MAG: sulfatase-like hydrolase/transferase [Parvibaculales bacterium]
MDIWMNLSKAKRVAVSVGLIVLLVLAVAYANRATLIVKTVGFIQKMNYPVAPHRAISWQSGSWDKEGKRPPNIIVILTDDMGFNDVSLYGGGLIETPHIDRLGKEGVRFANGYAGSAVCAPSRAMLMTGRYSTRFGFEFTPAPNAFGPILQQFAKADPAPRTFKFHEVHADNPHADHDMPYEAKGMPNSEITLAEELQRAGYHNLHIGKWHLGRNQGMHPLDQGFDESLLMASGLYLPIDDPQVVNARNEFAILDSVQWEVLDYSASFNRSDNFRPKGYLTDYYTDEAVKAIAANKDRPFFLYLAHWGIHTPLQATKEDYQAVGDNFPNHRSRVYAAMIRAVDRSVGKVMQALKDNGLDDNTLVIFTSDNGGANYIGMPDINKPYRGWKLSFFEGGTHIPYVMRWPNGLPSGKTYPHAVSHLDIMPTALGAAGLTPQAEVMDGVNLLPYLKGRKAGRPHETLIWREGHYQAIMSGGWKLQRSMDPKKIRLFDMAKDPLEQNEVSGQNPKKVAALIAMLDAHNAQQAAPLWPSRVSVPIWIDKTPADKLSLDDDYIYWPN